MPSPAAQPPQLSRLLWWHYRWHLVVGLAIWTGVVAAFVLAKYLQDRSIILHEPFYAHNQAESLLHAASSNAELGFMLLVTGFVPAAIGGLIRFPAMEFLGRRARSRNELIWKSLLVFAALVFIATLVPWPIAYNRFSAEMVGRQLRVLSLISLPWLLSSGLASHKLARRLGLSGRSTPPAVGN
ncbi:hypothetical protein [Hymenobacter properus]|uniref:Uncharacterized protein n=1 Tax=Hymenobacter properus TaxID=2791026 RepID=A0A931BM77_9BACT|nr:hypothetical protein [Hymenobacter properus]MBF9142015.1 hypothetical protein [Hymenobacter properus]MBR7720822.1 hypothetical protein [Microvirga sp. SRT04]